MRLIQERHPDIEFDWPQLLKGRQESASTERPRQDESPRGERPAKGGERSDRPERRGRVEGGRRSDRRPEPAEVPDQRPARVTAPLPPPPSSESQEPLTDPGPAGTRLGAAGLDRLRARYREVLARIAHRVEDEEQRAELNGLAERLNPDNWTSDEAVSAGLEAYEETFDAVKSGVGGRRKAAAEPEPLEREAPEPEADTSTDPDPR